MTTDITSRITSLAKKYNNTEYMDTSEEFMTFDKGDHPSSDLDQITK
jgi:hypothetical protein